MGRNSKKKLKPEGSKKVDNLVQPVVISATIPPKPLHWSEIGSEEGYDRNLEVERVYKEWEQKCIEAAKKTIKDSEKQIIFRSRSNVTLKNDKNETNPSKKRLKSS